jgi:hypothetical protein
MRLLATFFCWLLLVSQAVAAQVDHAWLIANLIAPTNLATLVGQRAANPRVQKAVYWLEMARKEGETPERVLDRALARAGYQGAAAALAKDRLLLKENDIDLVLTDVDLDSGINGIELAQKSLREKPGVKIIYMSGAHQHLIPPSAIALEKPFKPEALKNAIAKSFADAE